MTVGGEVDGLVRTGAACIERVNAISAIENVSSIAASDGVIAIATIDRVVAVLAETAYWRGRRR